MSSEIPIQQYMNDPNDSLTVSLVKLTGKKIKDIEGYISKEGDAIFALHRVSFEDDTYIFFEGEHDLAYLYPYRNGAQYLVNINNLSDYYEEDGEDGN